jgi:hypothetical protein
MAAEARLQSLQKNSPSRASWEGHDFSRENLSGTNKGTSACTALYGTLIANL